MTQAGVDVSKHGGHAYPGMEEVYNVELRHLQHDDIMTDQPDQKFHGSDGINYPGGSNHNRLQSQVWNAFTQVLARRQSEQVALGSTQKACPTLQMWQDAWEVPCWIGTGWNYSGEVFLPKSRLEVLQA